MSNKSNDEKLRILKERLAQIKQKQETPASTEQQKEDVIITDAAVEENTREKNSYRWLKYLVFIGILGYGSFYAFNNINFSELTRLNEEETNDPKEFILKYKLNMQGENIVITNSFKEESLAKALVIDLKVKGFKADYFYLPNMSNSTEEVYQVFIGPYENNEEARQWSENLESDFDIIKF